MPDIDRYRIAVASRPLDERVTIMATTAAQARTFLRYSVSTDNEIEAGEWSPYTGTLSGLSGTVLADPEEFASLMASAPDSVRYLITATDLNVSDRDTLIGTDGTATIYLWFDVRDWGWRVDISPTPGVSLSYDGTSVERGTGAAAWSGDSPQMFVTTDPDRNPVLSGLASVWARRVDDGSTRQLTFDDGDTAFTAEDAATLLMRHTPLIVTNATLTWRDSTWEVEEYEVVGRRKWILARVTRAAP